MRWYVKATIQYVLASVPGGMKVNDMLSRNMGELAQLETHVGDRLSVLLKLVNTSSRFVDLSSNPRVVEIGTGWVPLLPMVLGLAGARTHTFDLNRFLLDGNIRRVLMVLRNHAPALASSLGIPEEKVTGTIEDSLRAEGSVDAMLEPFNVVYTAPSDATSIPLENDSVDLYMSNLVCAHIPRTVIPILLGEMKRVLKDDAYAIHRIRMSDEYAASDPRSHEMNFLKFSTPFWNRFFNTRIKYLNRLRCSEWKQEFEKAGFELIESEEHVSREGLEALKTMKIAREFEHFEPKDLVTALMIGVWRNRAASAESTPPADAAAQG